MPKSKPSLIGIAGYPESGKDAAASFLQARGWKVIECSERVKRALLALNPIVCMEVTNLQGALVQQPIFFHEFFHQHCKADWVLAKKNPEVRRLLQHLGTNAGREIHGEDCWIRPIMQQVDHLNEIHKHVITGVRFQNEMDNITSRGGLMIWLDRESSKPLKHQADNTAWVREQCLVVDNNGTKEDLETKILVAAGIATNVAL